MKGKDFFLNDSVNKLIKRLEDNRFCRDECISKIYLECKTQGYVIAEVKKNDCKNYYNHNDIGICAWNKNKKYERR